MNKFRKRLIHLHRIHCLNRNQLTKLLLHDPLLKNIHTYSTNDFQKLLLMTTKKATSLYKNLHSKLSQRETLNVMNNYNVVTIVDDEYPSVLKTIEDPPLVFYTIGNVKLLKQYPSLSVIGTRNPSVRANKKLTKIIKPIVQSKWVVVSGMALGIDSFAHQLTLNLAGKTIAVLGSGFDYIYPSQNKSLCKSISKKGLVITEYPPHIRPARYHFPERNRIISGLSFGTLVIEATKKSGTLITVDQALDQGREVYAVPDSPLVRQAIGCNMLIRDGATLVTSAEDILDDWDQIGQFLFGTTN